ncbi:hypothetical protein ACLMJK_007665 [Lecanora helva]
MAAAQSPVTASLNAASPVLQIHGSPTNLKDDWRMVEDEDWPSALISSLEQDQSSPHRNVDTVTSNDANHHSPSSDSSGRSSQRAPMNVTLLIRPVSSHEDPAAGFSFTKAKPMQPLDFTRKIASNPTVPKKSNASPTPAKADPPVIDKQPADTGEIHDGTSSGEGLSKSKTPLSACDDLKKLFSVPFPDVAIVPPQIPETQARNRVSLKASHSTAAPATNDVAMSGEDTLVETGLHETASAVQKVHWANDPVSVQDPVPNTIPPEQQLSHTPPAAQKVQTLANKVGETLMPSRGEARTIPKGKKSSRKQQAPQPSVGAGASAPSHEESLQEADLLQILVQKHQQKDLQYEKLRKAFQAKEDDYQELYSATDDIHSQLQDVSQRYRASEAQLAKIKSAKASWESRVKKLTEFVQGLTKDHSRLRDDAKEISSRQASIIEHKESISKTLREVHAKVEQRDSTFKDQIIKAGHDMQTFMRAADDERAQLHQTETQLSCEREKNAQLERQITILTANHNHLISSATEHRDTLSVKMNEMIERFKQMRNIATPDPSESLRPLLEQCLSMLQELPERKDYIRSTDMQKLDDSLQNRFAVLNNSLTNSEQNSITIRDEQRRLLSSIQQHFESLHNDVATEHALSEQIMNLREMKAAVSERLQASEKALQDARIEKIRLELKISEQSSRIAVLENDTRSCELREDPRLILRIQELDTQARDLRNDMDTTIKERDALHDQMQQKNCTLEQMQAELLDTQKQLGSSRQQTDDLRHEKSQCERKAEEKSEEMRKQLSQAADEELDALRSNHLNELQKIKLDHVLDEKKNKESALELHKLQKEKEELERQATDANASSKALLIKVEEQVTLNRRLEVRVFELEGQNHEKQTTNDSIQQLLRETELDCKAKDEYIKGMQKAAVRKKNTPHSAGQPSHLATVVDDSQPDGHPSFASHEDIMGNDQGFYPTVPQEDLSGLFPATPKVMSQDLEVSHVTFSSTRVTSRDGQTSSKTHQKGFQKSQEAASGQGSRPRLANRGFHNSPSALGSQSKPGKSPVSSKILHGSSQGQGNAPRGILKPTQQDGRGEKRIAAEVEKGDTADPAAAPKKRKSNPTRDLGPIVADSQSPGPKMTGRGRKQIGGKPRKDDKWMKSFENHMNDG